MIKYLKMKAMEIEIKYMMYSTIITLMKEQKNVIDLVQKLYIALNDVPMEDLRKELISQIANLAHEQAMMEREK